MSDERAEQAITAKAEELAAVSVYSVEDIRTALWSVANAYRLVPISGETPKEGR